MNELAEEGAGGGASAKPDAPLAVAVPERDPFAEPTDRLPPRLSFLVIAVLVVLTWAALILGVALMPMWAAP